MKRSWWICLAVFILLQFWVWDYEPAVSVGGIFQKADVKVGHLEYFKGDMAAAKSIELCYNFEGEVLITHDQHVITFLGHDHEAGSYFTIEVLDAPRAGREIIEKVEISDDGLWMNVHYRRNNGRAFIEMIVSLIVVLVGRIAILSWWRSRKQK